MKKLLSTRIAVGSVLSALLLVCVVTSVQAAETPARASRERSVEGLTPQEYWNEQQQLNRWLMSELPAGALDKPIQIPLTGKDRRAIANDKTPYPRPLRVGIVKRVGKAVHLWRGGPGGMPSTRPAHGVKRGTDDGGFVWAMTVESEGALALRLRLTDVSLPETADLYFFTLDGQAHGPYRGQSSFWTNSVMGSQGIVLVRQFGPVAADTPPISLTVSSVGKIGEQFATAAFEALCSYNHECVENVLDHDDQAPVPDLKAATAYMEWVQGAWIYSCSGGLLADNDPNSQIPYFLTANHCLKSGGAARNLELFWNYTTETGGCSGPGSPMTSGATIKTTGAMGDFTLLELDEPPPLGSVFMGWTSEEVARADGLPLHRVHHPKGAPQSYTSHVVDSDFGTCAGLPIPQFIYSLDTLGTTEGGSSGSLVTNDVGEVVGQLYGGCGSYFDECFSDSWRTVDGAFSYYYDKVAPYLSSSCDPLPEICTDGLDNDCDTDIDCSDSDCALDPDCGTLCGPKNAACSVDTDCCSGLCKRNGRCR
jgi:V8-like Glu-specific endopeptidase